MEMLDFGINRFFSEPWKFVILVLVLTLLFHFLVWPRNLSKANWKRVDYIWVSAGMLGLLSVVADVRISTAKNWVEIERSRAQAIWDSFSYVTAEPESSHFCSQFTRTESSPSDFEYIQEQYNVGCEWLKNLEAYFSTYSGKKLPDLTVQDIPEIKFNNPVINDSSDWIKARVSDYERQMSALRATEDLHEIKSWERQLKLLAPFLLCGALALRLAKVSGEVKHEKRNV